MMVEFSGVTRVFACVFNINCFFLFFLFLTKRFALMLPWERSVTPYADRKQRLLRSGRVWVAIEWRTFAVRHITGQATFPRLRGTHDLYRRTRGQRNSLAHCVSVPRGVAGRLAGRIRCLNTPDAQPRTLFVTA